MPKTGRPRIQDKCSVDGCDRLHYGRGMCRPHFYRWRRNGTPGKASIGQRLPTGLPCSIHGCDRRGHTSGLCNAHYLRSRKGRDLSRPLRNRARNGAGSRWRDRNGYVILTLPGKKGRIAEHRYIMEQTLGRQLFPDETVHHKNGIKDDNRPDNLELWSALHPSGQRVADMLVWAREIINRYG